MNDQGYTLAEMLAALLIIGLAMAGLTQAVRVLGLFQSSAARAAGEQRTLRRAEVDLARLMDGQGPFRSTEATLTGDGSRFDFDCGRPKRCAALLEPAKGVSRLSISGPFEDRVAVKAGARFTYATDKAALSAWPPAGERETLRSVNLVGPDGEPIASTRLWVQQSGDCAFDAIAQDCREAAR
jgi:prepilin-type N-terminal cleavage/methylation domain-containing protein